MMSCEEIAAVLDRHEADALSAARRTSVDTHLEACADCAGIWLAAERLRRERWPGSPPNLLRVITARLDAQAQVADIALPDAPRESRRSANPRTAVFAALAASVVLAAGLAVLLGVTGSERAPSSTARVASSSDEDRGHESNTDRASSGNARSAVLDTETPFELGRHYRLAAPMPSDANPSNRAASRNVAALAAAAAVPVPGTASGGSATRPAAAPNSVEVAEFFMYGCYPCYAFEPHLENFRTTAEHIALYRVPVVFNPASRVHARAFYAAGALGVLEAMHAELFAAVHERGNGLDREAALIELFAAHGVDETAFLAAYRSPEVSARVDAAVELASVLGVTATPTLIVGWTYSTSPSMAGAYGDLFALVDRLAASLLAGDRCPGSPQTLRALLELIELGDCLPARTPAIR